MHVTRLRLFAAAALVAATAFAAAPVSAGQSCESKGTSASAAGYSKGHTKSAASGGDIVQVATKAGSFQTLLAAAQAAGLVDALKGEGPLTVFAPTDEAFSRLPKGTVESLLEPANRSKLARILKYHVIAGRVSSSSLSSIAALRTLEGGSLSVTTESGVRVQKSNVVMADIAASNGLIHVIDAVLMPEASASAMR